jgi:hypothetical protein
MLRKMKMNRRSLRPLNARLFGSLLLVFSSLAILGAQFYVDSTIGNDDNLGTSRRQPWRSLDKVNAATFVPGDRMRFRAGSVWSSQLVISAKGATGRPVVFEAYGRGPRPRIDAAGKFADAVVLSNAQYVVFRDFELTNTGAAGSRTNTPPRRGVHIIADNVGTLTNILVSDLLRLMERQFGRRPSSRAS